MGLGLEVVTGIQAVSSVDVVPLAVKLLYTWVAWPRADRVDVCWPLALLSHVMNLAHWPHVSVVSCIWAGYRGVSLFRGGVGSLSMATVTPSKFPSRVAYLGAG